MRKRQKVEGYSQRIEGDGQVESIPSSMAFDPQTPVSTQYSFQVPNRNQRVMNSFPKEHSHYANYKDSKTMSKEGTTSMTESKQLNDVSSISFGEVTPYNHRQSCPIYPYERKYNSVDKTAGMEHSRMYRVQQQQNGEKNLRSNSTPAIYATDIRLAQNRHLEMKAGKKQTTLGPDEGYPEVLRGSSESINMEPRKLSGTRSDLKIARPYQTQVSAVSGGGGGGDGGDDGQRFIRKPQRLENNNELRKTCARLYGTDSTITEKTLLPGSNKVQLPLKSSIDKQIYDQDILSQQRTSVIYENNTSTKQGVANASYTTFQRKHSYFYPPNNNQNNSTSNGELTPNLMTDGRIEKTMLGDIKETFTDDGSMSFDIDDTILTVESLESDADHMRMQPPFKKNAADQIKSADEMKKQLDNLTVMYYQMSRMINQKQSSHARRPWSIASSEASSLIRENQMQKNKSLRNKVIQTRHTKRKFQRLESNIVSLSHNVTCLTSQVRSYNGLHKQIDTLKQDLQDMKNSFEQFHINNKNSNIVNNTNNNNSNNSHNNNSNSSSNNNINQTYIRKISFEKFRCWLPSLTNRKRVHKLTRFFGEEPPLLEIFLQKLGYERYVTNFSNEHIGMLELPYMTEDRLKSIGIPMGPRLRILQEAQLCFRQENFDIYIV
ncbi:putative uncharacterized protein DDB_G0277255 isoform X2 [Octopus bimaculoides]|uniref:putative uncharacterized protein DDB_G0277255 isoform X2 n=1 Tax=Octopus bimaculoides TaxID=37653 RepID=UPI0022E4AB07|nr:putative uncharacterized protein DDB_G0277255 isoform X2 [Octopus bimaculoides]